MSQLPSVDNLTGEQKERVSQMRDLDEFMSYVSDEGIELTDEQLDAVSGGDYSDYANAYGQALCH